MPIWANETTYIYTEKHLDNAPGSSSLVVPLWANETGAWTHGSPWSFSCSVEGTTEHAFSAVLVCFLVVLFEPQILCTCYQDTFWSNANSKRNLRSQFWNFLSFWHDFSVWSWDWFFGFLNNVSQMHYRTCVNSWMKRWRGSGFLGIREKSK
jgi:hypothetical protein